ncbi:MAG: S8 family serine peptidase [Chitinispirillaceae bacterium]|nr:S8 family serine peptidase [Chitinispirillaceae bacterium]
MHRQHRIRTLFPYGTDTIESSGSDDRVMKRYCMKHNVGKSQMVAFVLLTVLLCGTVSAKTRKNTVPSVSPMAVLLDREHAPEPHPASALIDNGDNYRYQGRRINLLKLSDRVAIAYRETHETPSPVFKRKARFRQARFRRIAAGKRRMEVMMIGSDQTDTTGQAEKDISAIITEVQSDPSVAWGVPVYYDPSARKTLFFTDNIAVGFTPDTATVLRRRVAAIIGTAIERKIMPSVYTYRCSSGGSSDVLRICRLLENVPGIEWVEPEIVTEISRCRIPDDPFFNRQWHLGNTGENSAVAGADLKAVDAWDIQRQADPDVVIAVIDDGVDRSHPDLRVPSGGRDFCDDDDDSSPADTEDSHGTAVAGVAAAIGDNALGVAGVAPGASILPVKISRGNSFIPSFDIAEALTWAYENGADILNNSWGGGLPSNAIATAIRNASTLGRQGKGCPVFFSSGNGASSFDPYEFRCTAGEFAVAFVYRKDASISYGNDRVVIDNIVIYGSDRYSILATETFSESGLPPGWSTSGGYNGSALPVPAVPGWWHTTSTFQEGFGDEGAMHSGSVNDNEWTELRMPLRTFANGEILQIHVSLSTQEAGDSLLLRFYNAEGVVEDENVFASGNTHSVSIMSFPASADSSIAVGASTDQDFRSDYSQYNVAGTGKTVDFLAPSGGGWNAVYTTDRTGTDGYSGDDYHSRFSGTSSACPAAAGVAALILSRNPHLSRDKVLEVLRSTCDKIGDAAYIDGKNNEYGYGRLNAYRALSNLPPVILGQNPVGVNRNLSITPTAADLEIIDTETPEGPFVLTVYDGDNYSVSGTAVTPATNFTGTLLVPVSVNDGIYESDRFTLSITVRVTNDLPIIMSQQPVTILEDGKYRISAVDLMIRDLDDPYGPFAITPSAGDDYTIVNDTIFPIPDFNGMLSIPITANDGFGGSSPFEFIIEVLPVNDAPVFTPGNDVTVNEDVTVYYINWAPSVSPGPPDESGQRLSFSVSVGGPDLFSVQPYFSPEGILSFSPAADANGTTPMTVRLHDEGGTSNGGIDSSVQETFSITFLPVNDPPSFSAGMPVTVNEDAGPQTIMKWATAISTGPANESGQKITFAVATNLPDLFSTLPEIASDGTLTFTPAADQFGTAMLTPRLTDDGGTESGGIDTATGVPFLITVVPVNDAPSFTPGADIVVNEDTGACSIDGWANDISAGPGEDGQEITFSISSDNPALFSTAPAIAASGTVTFTPAADSSGSATIAVQLLDNGGTVNGGTESSETGFFTLTVLAVDDPPAITTSGSLNCPLGEESVITVKATDPDGTITDISVTNLPPFATCEISAEEAHAVIICSPQTDTGLFTFEVIANDSRFMIDTVITLTVFVNYSGAIEVIGAPPTSTVGLFASSGWIGKRVRNGSGRIDNCPAGTYLLSISDSSSRTEYYRSTVVPFMIDSVNVHLRPRVAIDFAAPETLRTTEGTISAGVPVSVVIDDADNDGYNDILYSTADGSIFGCKRSGEIYSPPELLHTVSEGTTVLRCLDWNEDGSNDLLTVNVNGALGISLGTGNQEFLPDSLLFSTYTGCTGAELVPHDGTPAKGFYFSFGNGSVVYNYPDEENRRFTLMVYDQNGIPLNGGENASIVAFDVTGDGKSELLIGNSTGSIEIFSRMTVDTMRSLGTVTADGHPLSGADGLSLSGTFGNPGELPSIVYADGNGTLLHADGTTHGDITGDGIVDIFDLQQLGIHWGLRDTDEQWSDAANLQVQTTTSDPQIIDVLDLRILARFWGAEK